MLRVCGRLQRVRLFTDDIVCFSMDGAEHVCDLDNFCDRLTKFDLKLLQHPRKSS